MPPTLPPEKLSVSLQRQYRRLRQLYRCWAFESSPGAGSAASTAASTAAREALCVPTAAVPELRDGFPRQKEPLEKNRRVQRHYRQTWRYCRWAYSLISAVILFLNPTHGPKVMPMDKPARIS